jgi:YaiO family outer membrane protein
VSATFFVLSLLAQLQPQPVTPAPGRTIEAGGFRHFVSATESDWSGAQLMVAWNPPARVRPTATFEWQTRRSGSQRMVNAGAYIDWSPRFYTLQTFAVGEQVPFEARYYPLRRGDVRSFVKLPRREQIVVANGFTALTFGEKRTAQVYNTGLIIYGEKTIWQVTAYVNHSHPGSLVSAAGTVAMQRGTEGVAWYGASFGAGRELYRLGDGLGVATADFTTVTAAAFGRKWLTRSLGVHGVLEYQRVLDSYSRVGVISRMFVNF